MVWSDHDPPAAPLRAQREATEFITGPEDRSIPARTSGRMSSNVDSMASQAWVANAASRRSCSAALADPDLVDVAIEPGSVTDAAGGSFRLAA